MASSTDYDDNAHDSGTAEYEPGALEYALSSLPPELRVLVVDQLDEERSLLASVLVRGGDDNAKTTVVIASDEPCPLLSLPSELLMLVVETLEPVPLANFAAASVVCLETTHGELRAALLAAVKRCLLPDTEQHWYVPDFWCQGQICDALVSCPYFRLPDDLLAVPAGFFRGSSVRELTLPAGLTSIGNFAFRLCPRLTKVSIPVTLTSIGNNAFDGSFRLTDLSLPDSLTTIGDFAFQGTCLTELTLPVALASMGEGVFDGCFLLAKISIPDAITVIGNFLCSGCIALHQITFPATLTKIGSYSFHNCTSLTNLSLPATLTTLGNGALRGCTRLSVLNLPASMTSIGSHALHDCSSLTHLTLPDTITSIGSNAFKGMASLTELNFPAALTTISDGICNGALPELNALTRPPTPPSC